MVSSIPDILELKRNYAENLKRESARFPSIAHVCRALQINRQQFNRYLSGRYLPRPATRRLISTLIGIPEDEMFQPAAVQDTSTGDFLADALATLSNAIPPVKNAHHAVIREGYYLLYFSLRTDPQLVVRSIIKIKLVNKRPLVVWHTLYHSIGLSKTAVARGRRIGAIIEVQKECWLLAVDRNRPAAPTVLRFGDDLEGLGPFRGAGTISGLSGAYPSWVALEFLGNGFAAAKRQMGKLGVVGLADETISAATRHIMAGDRGLS